MAKKGDPGYATAMGVLKAAAPKTALALSGYDASVKAARRAKVDKMVRTTKALTGIGDKLHGKSGKLKAGK
jgi:hypothetical protein